MIEPLPIGNSLTPIKKNGTFSLTAKFPDSLQILFNPLAGNEKELIIFLDSIIVNGNTIITSISDTLAMETHIGGSKYIRPDGIGLVYPNPISGRSLNVKFETDVPGEIQLDFITTAGRRVRGLVVDVKEKGRFTYEFELPENLASGNYMFILTSRYGRSYQLVSYRR